MTRRYSFQGLLLVTLLTLALGSLALASAMTFRVHRRAVDRLSTSLTEQTLQRVTDRLDELVRTAVKHADLYPQLTPDGQLKSADFPRLFDRLWATVSPHEEFSYFGVGIASTGEYAMVRHERNQPLEIRMYVRDGDTGPQIRDYVPADNGLKLVRTLPWKRDGDPQTNYEVRLRPFYVQANRARRSIWTDSYEFWGGTVRGPLPGVTYATPVYDSEGQLALVWDIDLELESLSQFLTRVQGVVTGRLLIVEHRQDGRWNVIAQAHPDPEEARHVDSQVAVERFLQRLPSTYSQAVAQFPEMSTVLVRGQAWRTTCAALQGPDRPQWIIVSLSPADAEPRAASFSDAEFLIAALVVGLLATAAAWGVSRNIAAPLITLEHDAQRLLLGASDMIAPLGGTDEIGRLAATLNALTHKVRDRQASLEQSNRELQQSRQRLLGHFDRTPIGALEMDASGIILRWNAAAEAMFGWQAAEVLGRRFDFVVPERLRPEIDTVVSRLLAQSGGFRNDSQNVTKDGRLIECEWYNTPFVDERGRVYGIACLVLDVTDRKRAEEEIRRLNVELEHRVVERTAQLTAAVKELEAFSYSVAHDLRSPLRSIAGFSQALQEDCGPWLKTTGLDYLDRIRAATQRMSELIDALLTLARVSRHSLAIEEVDLSELIEQALARCWQHEPARDVISSITPHLLVRGDRMLLQILINNLIDNAWKYTRHAHPARIEFGVREAPGGHEFFLRDNGVGFDPQFAANLFQPFQRLHRVDEFEGHGVGLATVQRIIDKHGGRVRLESQVGQGATCYFTLSNSNHG